MLHALCITVYAYVVCHVRVFVSSGEWAQIGNPVYGVIDFPVLATGSVWLLIPRDSDVTQTVQAVYLSMIRSEVLSLCTLIK